MFILQTFSFKMPAWATTEMNRLLTQTYRKSRMMFNILHAVLFLCNDSGIVLKTDCKNEIF